MKAKLIRDFVTIDGITIPTGTEVEITDGYCGCNGYFYTCIIPSGEMKVINNDSLVITDHTPWKDWEKMKFNAAISIAQGFAANSSLASNGEEYIAEKSVRVAELLIEKLRERSSHESKITK